MDVFCDVVENMHGILLNAVTRAAVQLGIFSLLSESGPETSHSATDIASALDLPEGRLARLLDILAAEGILSRTKDSGPDRFRLSTIPTVQNHSAGDWDKIAEVVSSDSPLELDPNGLRDHLTYVASKGEVVAPLLWEHLRPKPGGRLLDVGGGLGAYSMAYLKQHADNSATLVDLPAVIDLLRETGCCENNRLEIRSGDALESQQEAQYDIVLLANLLHLFGPDENRRIVENAVESVRPGGSVVVKDVLIFSDRTGPPVGLYFALNMALYTNAGDVYPNPRLTSWMSEAGLENIRITKIAPLTDTAILVGTRPQG